MKKLVIILSLVLFGGAAALCETYDVRCVDRHGNGECARYEFDVGNKKFSARDYNGILPTNLQQSIIYDESLDVYLITFYVTGYPELWTGAQVHRENFCDPYKRNLFEIKKKEK